MKEIIEKRFASLLDEGKRLTTEIPKDSDGRLDFYIEDDQLPRYEKWINSSANLITVVCPGTSPFLTTCNRLLMPEEKPGKLEAKIVLKMAGLLESVWEEWQNGLLRTVEYIVTAATFDDFLDHADAYHKSGKKIEASVLASAVLEDTVKKIATKNGIDPKGQTLDPLIDALVKANVITPVKAKRAKSYAGVRNHALHAEWDKFEIQDVRALISGTKELIEEHL